MINAIVENFFKSLPTTVSVLIVLGFSLLVLLIAILISFLLIRAILRIKWKNQTITRFIQLRNEGNVNQKFLLRVDVPKSELLYQCLLEGKALPKSNAVQRIVVSRQVRLEQKAGETKLVIPSSNEGKVENQSKDNNEAKKKITESANKAKDKTKKGLGFVRLISGILGSLGSIIPGSVGRSFKEKSGELQKASQDASAKIQMPEQKLKSVEHLKGQVNQITPGDKDQKAVPAQVQTGQTKQVQSVSNNNILELDSDSNSNNPQVREVPYIDYLETPTLSPGTSFCLEILMDPIHPYRSGKYFIEVIIRQIQSLNDLLSKDLAVTNSSLNVSVNGLSPVFWILSFAMVLTAIVINVTWAVFFINWLARFVI